MKQIMFFNLNSVFLKMIFLNVLYWYVTHVTTVYP